MGNTFKRTSSEQFNHYWNEFWWKCFFLGAYKVLQILYQYCCQLRTIS